MNDTPEAIRDRILQEELAKGSDPRVAEARAKAAEMRAKDGLPIDPAEAWPIKLQRAGSQVSAKVEPAPAEPAPAEPAPAEPAPAEAPAPAPEVPGPSPSSEAPASPEAPAQEPTPAPAQVEVSHESVPYDPEVGQPIGADDESILTIGGIQVRDVRVPAWLVAALVLIPLWAAFYLVAIGGPEVQAKTSGCIVQQDRTFQCFQQGDVEAPEGGSPGAH